MNGFAIDILLRVSLLLLLGIAFSMALRRSTAALRHLVLRIAVSASLVLPLVMLMSPRWELRILPSSVTVPGDVTPDPSVAVSRPGGSVKEAPLPVSGRSHRALAPSARGEAEPILGFRVAGSPFVAIWLLGALMVLGWLIAGHLRLRRILKTSWPLTASEWEHSLGEEMARAGVEQSVRLASSPAVSTPITWGIFRPAILLPDDSLDWTDDHRRVVLRHELAHIARGDAGTQLMAAVACAAYWFHPLVWMAETMLRRECERACDDRVVSSGTSAVAYASHLLEVAKTARSFGGPGFLSVAMARPSQLEGRLLAVLNEKGPHSSVTPGGRRAVLALSLILIGTLSAFSLGPRRMERSRSVIGNLQRPKTPILQAPAPQTSGTTRQGVPESRRQVTTAATEAPVALVSSPAASDSLLDLTIDVQPAGTLYLDFTRSGATIAISAWDEPRVTVKGTLGGRDWRQTETSFERVSGGVRLRNRYIGGSGSTSFSHHFEIRVPRNYSVQLASAGGGISIEGVKGKFAGSTGGGEIEFDRSSGEVDLRTGGGDIHVTNSALDGSVATGGGAVRIEDNSGDLTGSSGSGDVEYRNSGPVSNRRGTGVGIPANKGTTTFLIDDDPEAIAHFGERGIRKHQSGGAISLDEAPDGARLTTGGGPIRIGRSAGEVYAHTGGGNIEIGPAEGSVVATTGAGDVTVAFRGNGPHAGDLTSGFGKITLVLPRDFHGTLVLETAYTNNLAHKTYIDSDWELPITETDNWDGTYGTPRRYVRARKIIGNGGGTIRVRTVNGNVIVRRAL